MSKNKLLLADDSITIQKVVNLTFADEGIEVVAVGDGDTALEKIQEFAPDLIMADVNMPGLNGYQICELVKQNPHLKEIPVILLVGSFEPFDEAEAQRVGADDFMTKPFQSIRQLVVKVTNLLERGGGETNEADDASQEFVDTLPDLNERLAAEKGFAVTDDEMIETSHYDHKTAETARLSPDYLHRINDFEMEQSDGSFQTDDGFNVENQSRLTEPAAQYDVEEAQYSSEPQAFETTDKNFEIHSENQSPAVYDFGDEQVAASEDFSKSSESEDDESRENESAENFDSDLTAQIEQTDEPRPAAIEAEKNSQPTSADIPELDDLDFLELPPLENTVVCAAKPETAEPPKGAPVENLAAAVQTEIAATAANSENSPSAPQLSPEAIEAIAQRVVEKLSERFFDKEA